MKNLMRVMGVMGVMVGLVGLVGLVGCRGKDEARIKQLESEVRELATNCLSLMGNVERGRKEDQQFKLDCVQNLRELLEMSTNRNSSMYSEIERHEIIITNMWALMKYDEKLIAKLQSEMSNKVSYAKPGTVQSYIPLVKMTPKLIRGIPFADYEEIEWAARKRWKTDYQMIEDEIKNQVEAYLKVNGGR